MIEPILISCAGKDCQDAVARHHVELRVFCGREVNRHERNSGSGVFLWRLGLGAEPLESPQTSQSGKTECPGSSAVATAVRMIENARATEFISVSASSGQELT